MIIYKTYFHNPPHLFRNNCKYFITAATYQHQPFLKDNESKTQLFDSLNQVFSKSNWTIEDWVILDNHYHLVVDASNKSQELSSMIKRIHSYLATWLNKRDDISGRRVWYNFWDSCITFEKSYFARIHYIWYNPVKHRYCLNAEDYVFGSFRARFIEEREYVDDIRGCYPCDAVKVRDLECISSR